MAADISERIKAVYSTLSKGQKKIANAVLNDYDKVAMNITLYLSEKFVAGTDFMAGYYSFDAEGKMIIE